MPLIPSSRHTPEDLAAWERWARIDAWRNTSARGRARLERLARTAQDDIAAFLAQPGYVGVSWGKDSVVVAHLARQAAPDIPLVWCRVGAADNPDCELVRDAFLAAWPGAYHEYTSPVELTDGELATGARQGAYAMAADAHGDRYVTGIRSQESRTRRIREALHGVASARTCAPITRWAFDDVFGYLALHDLPVHPVYAMSRGGLLERGWLRVGSLGGKRGTGRGRREWEWAYYEAELLALGVGAEDS